MSIKNNHAPRHARRALCFLLTLLLSLAPLTPAFAQDPVTGAFEGTVSNSQTGAPISGAVVQFVNQTTQVPVAKRSDAGGRFYQGLLQPGVYRIRVSAPAFKTKIVEQRLLATKGNTVVPLPVTLDPEVAATPQPTTPTQPTNTTPTTPTTPTTTTPPQPPPQPPAVVSEGAAVELNITDGRRSGAFTEEEVATLPLGNTTYTRTFDHFALLIPGLALPPQTLGRVSGPGVGAGVGSAGQFSANGLRSRANNFLVDGSDNNDEDIGVRRQGFFTLVPQPPESIKEYQVITALAPAQFGRNIGAQVNAISKSGGQQTHGTFYGFLNTSDLNARNYFDTVGRGQASQLQGRALNADLTTLGGFRNVSVDGAPLLVANPAGARKDSLTFGQAGFVLGGPLLPSPQTDASGNVVGSTKRAFYFIALEGQLLNGNQETNFAVPNVEQRGFLQSGASGFRLGTRNAFPTTFQGDAIFSLFPFPNNPTGVYGRNTYTQLLPASAQGYVGSLKLDHSLKLWNREQSFTGRYNRTHDWRDIPAAGGALFAVLRPIVGTQNFSFFWNSEVSGPDAVTPIFNQFRASYGRTRLFFEEVRDRDHLIPSAILPNEKFLLNAPLLLNTTLPTDNFVDYRYARSGTGALRNTELGRFVVCPPNPPTSQPGFGQICGGALGPLGQVVIPGYSPVGADVNNFQQRRVNNTFQFADILSFRKGFHSVAFGADIRRVQLNSDLPRNARSQLIFGGGAILNFDVVNGQLANYRLSDFFRPDTLAAASAASNFVQTLALGTSNIGLRYRQSNFFAQDEWRVRPNFSLSFGLRYEYNTPPSEVDGLIESTFNNAALNLPTVAGLKQFIAGREKIFDPDRNNFAPRVGAAYNHNFGLNRQFVIRGGYGMYYDQALGAVVSQSRNVFPNFLTINTGGGLGGTDLDPFDLFNPALSLGGTDFSNGIRLANGNFFPYVVRGTLNQFNRNIPLDVLVNTVNREFPGGFGFTLPSRNFPMPRAHHYSLTVEQQVAANLVASVGYVGTLGRSLLRLTTPNLGPNLNMVTSPLLIDIGANGTPTITGLILPPGQNITPQLQRTGGRPFANAGTVYIYETTARSRYDSLQAQLRGRIKALNFQVGYTWAKALDDVSDVFDLAGAPGLPQNSRTFAGERGPANFDTRHRFAYSFNWTLPTLSGADKAKQLLLGGFELAGIGQFQTGQPYTINSLLDINLDGNLTDRINTTNGLAFSDSRRQPVRLNTNFGALWAGIGRDGAVSRNRFRASNYLLLDLALIKNFIITDRQRVIFRAEAFNFLNRANFAIPVRFLEAPGFGEAVDTITPGRRIQFALKYSF